MTTHETATRYPLTWPAGWKRTPTAQRARARFRSGRTELSIYEATQRLQGELERLERGIGGVVLSTNVETRLDGMPRSDRRAPADPGAAVYFRLKGQPRCLACDKWDRVADNIAAIAAHIEAIRAVDRYGVGTLDQAFAGYAALPAPAMGIGTLNTRVLQVSQRIQVFATSGGTGAAGRFVCATKAGFLFGSEVPCTDVQLTPDSDEGGNR
mgnify:CR=1 FL=1